MVMESLQAQHTAQLLALQLHVEDLEDQGRLNNPWLRGLREVEGAEGLEGEMTAIFQAVLYKEASVQLDRVHRAIGPKPTDPGRPRDVICRLHYFPQKDTIT